MKKTPLENNLYAPKPKAFSFRTNKAGFSLIELMVAVVVLSVGLLGLAGLQCRALQNNQSASLRSRAVQCGQDILDRMRSNRSAALGGDYDIPLDTDPADLSYSGIVLTDLDQWKTALSAALPEGDGSVAVNGNIATVVINWSEAVGAQTVSVVTRL